MVYVCSINKKYCCFYYNVDLIQILFLICVKLIGYFVSAINVWFNPCLGPSPRIKISFPLLSTLADELISATKIITVLPILPSVNENSERDSNPMP